MSSTDTNTDPDGPPPPPRATCNGFFALAGNVQQPYMPTATPNPRGNHPCGTALSTNAYGYCMCGDSLPRFVIGGKNQSGSQQAGSCNRLCYHEPGAPLITNIPPILGLANDGADQETINQTVRMVKLSGALGLIMVGISLLVFHFNFKKQFYIGEKGLSRLVHASETEPSASGGAGANNKDVQRYIGQAKQIWGTGTGESAQMTQDWVENVDPVSK